VDVDWVNSLCRTVSGCCEEGEEENVVRNCLRQTRRDRKTEDARAVRDREDGQHAIDYDDDDGIKYWLSR